MTKMDYYAAMVIAHEGKRVKRLAWDAVNQNIFVFSRPEETLDADFIPKVKYLPQPVKDYLASLNKPVKFSRYLCLYNGKDMVINNWQPSELDIKVKDWICID